MNFPKGVTICSKGDLLFKVIVLGVNLFKVSHSNTIRQTGLFPQFCGVKIKKIFEVTS